MLKVSRIHKIPHSHPITLRILFSNPFNIRTPHLKPPHHCYYHRQVKSHDDKPINIRCGEPKQADTPQHSPPISWHLRLKTVTFPWHPLPFTAFSDEMSWIYLVSSLGKGLTLCSVDVIVAWYTAERSGESGIRLWGVLVMTR